MEVSMDTNASTLPQPQSTSPYPPSPTASRKRSIQDIDAQTAQAPTTATAVHTDIQTPSAYTDKDDQDNADPSIRGATRVGPAMEVSHVLISSGEQSVGSKIGDEALVQNTKEATSGEPAPSSGLTGPASMSHLSTCGGATTPALKKRKLSPASKEAKQQEKEAKERQRLEERAKKEEEKRLKDEEKKKREVEREEERKRKEDKKKAKEEEKAAKEEEKRKRDAAKEEEKRKREEEKLKKERAQPTLNAFFAKPKPLVQPSVATVARSPKESGCDGAANESPREANAASDYQRAFPSFFLQSHTKVAPPHRFGRDSEALRIMRENVDVYLKSPSSSEDSIVFRPLEIFNMIPYRRRRGRLPASVREILLQMQTLNDQAGTSEATQRQQCLLKKVRMKSLKFGEDVRPPYQGTYSKQLPGSSASKMMRNPFHRGLPDTNYDYDSEAEWEEPEEGEELDSEEEEEMSDDGDDDMDGFLDDDDDQLVDGKRRLIVGDLEPVCTGIQWHDQGVDPEFKAYKIQTIPDTVSLPIDPFSTAYWQKPNAPEPAQTSGPGRSMLHSFLRNPSMQDGSALPLLGSGRSKRTFPPEQLAEFKHVVDGSDLSKLGLIEILKKRFPKVSKDVLKDTLNSVATRVGQKEAEKKWVCK
ncbi:chromatin assembly factor 1 subunit A-domain-containing protein [Aspergillus coremiiformis]|uniref:Chromatin assembly factor 1 subunit A-domain-containing protein n=1 Tax=Aspergillus coremiiformis TaxID=138285 RepID=A0A5N6YTB7_9EURO|nr:chromatin assembly factor 1 subunit A-domain-containing protein [Aspergillus coremiiformis]